MESLKLLSERLQWARQQKEARDKAKVTGVSMALASGASTAAVSRWLGDLNGIDAKYARPLAEYLGVDPLWLENGAGSPIPSGDSAQVPAGYRRVIEHDPDNSNFVEIRKVKLKLSAGITGFQTEPDDDHGRPITFRKEWFQKNNFVPSKLVATGVKGESMLPTMSDGDTVVINTADTVLKDREIYAVNFDGEDVIKRMVKDYGRWFLVSDNPDQNAYHRQECTSANCVIIGRVVLLQREKF